MRGTRLREKVQGIDSEGTLERPSSAVKPVGSLQKVLIIKPEAQVQNSTQMLLDLWWGYVPKIHWKVKISQVKRALKPGAGGLYL
jgi:hypothetical protein